LQYGGAPEKETKKEDGSDSDTDTSEDSEELRKYFSKKKKEKSFLSEDEYVYPVLISSWTYDPSIYKLDKVIVPTFAYPLKPVVVVGLN
jgi:hypothetical protein